MGIKHLIKKMLFFVLMKKNNYIFSIICLILIFFIFLVFYNQIKEVGVVFVSTFSFFGIFILTLILDTLIQPISPSWIIFLSAFGGADVFKVVLFAGLGTCLAAIFGYLLGRNLGRNIIKNLFGKTNLRKGKHLTDKYGIWAVLIGSWTPFPYSLVNWTAGIYKMNFLKFITAVILIRVPKIFVVALIGSII